MTRIRQYAKEYVKAKAPEKLLAIAKSPGVARDLMPAFSYDLVRYWTYSSSLGVTRSQLNLKAAITERYHSIEKGLSLPSPRPGFGAKPLKGLLDLVDVYVARFGVDDLVLTVRGVLSTYLEFNEVAGLGDCSIPEYSRIVEFLNVESPPTSVAGTVAVRREDVAKTTAGVTVDFFKSRSSVRQFSAEKVLYSEIASATEVAMKAPAVCNRQFGRVHAYSDIPKIAELLDIQGGASGFGDELTGLAIVTTNLRAYWNSGQRNQAWIDGGLFAMSFVFGLHAQNIGTVCLNWSKKPSVDQELRRAAEIGQDEAIIMLVGYGKLKDEYVVAASNRQHISSVLSFDGRAQSDAGELCCSNADGAQDDT